MGFSSLVSFVLALVMWVWPVDGPVVRPFDPPPQPWLPGHRGADLAGTVGGEIKAAGAGVVAFAGVVVDRPLVSIDHAGGLRTTYEPVTPVVRAGESVAAGDIIGHLLPGHAGCPRACLHWGLRHGDDYLDPLALMVPVRVRLLPTGTGEHPRSPAPPAVRRRALRQFRCRAMRCGRRCSRLRSSPLSSRRLGFRPLGSLPLESLPLESLPLESLPLESLPLGSRSRGCHPLGSLLLRFLPMRSLPWLSAGCGGRAWSGRCAWSGGCVRCVSGHRAGDLGAIRWLRHRGSPGGWLPRRSGGRVWGLGAICCRRAPSVHPPARRPHRDGRPCGARPQRRICMSRNGFRSIPRSARRHLAPTGAGAKASGPPGPPRPPAPPGQPPAESSPAPRRLPRMDLCWSDVPLGWGFAVRGHRLRRRLGRILGRLRALRCHAASLRTSAWQAVVVASARRRRRPTG